MPHTDNLKLYDGLPQRLLLATVTPKRRYPTLVRNQAGLQGRENPPQRNQSSFRSS